ncbi:MAG: pyridoxamine 5'-phosphate oxidase family protein [Sporichthyaceae bacterium]
MSIAVSLPELGATLGKFPFVYLLSVGDNRPHILALPARVVDGVVVLPAVGGGSSRRIEANELVTLLAPPYEEGGYSLIVDGTARLLEDGVEVAPTWAVLHRPAPAG